MTNERPLPLSLLIIHHSKTSWHPRREGGGGERDRTDDLMLAKHALSQLSYTPSISPGGSGWVRTTDPRLIKTVL
jgi:hypothetical protein